MPPYFIDFEAFQHGDGDFEVKELCMVDVDKLFGKHLYLLVGPSGEWYNLEHGAQCTYNYQSQHLHRLGWYEDVTPYCRYLVLHEITKYFPMFSRAITYVMGAQKMQFLKKEYGAVMNLAEYFTTKKTLPQLPSNIKCSYRNHDGEHYACLKCYRLVEHYYELSQN